MKKSCLIILLLTTFTARAQFNDSALINSNWKNIANDTTLTFTQMVHNCDSEFSIAGYKVAGRLDTSGADSVLDGSPFYEYTTWKNFFATRLDNATGKPHNFAVQARTSGLTGGNCGGTSSYQAGMPAIPHVYGWQFIGPNNTAQDLGEANKIIVNPGNADEVYAADKFGGLWKTANGTAATPTWTNLTDNLAAIAGIGVTQFYVNFSASPHTLYCLIGIPFAYALNNNSDNNPHTVGIYKSTDDGATFSALTYSSSVDLSVVNDMEYWPGTGSQLLFLATYQKVIRLDVSTSPATVSTVLNFNPSAYPGIIPADDSSSRFRGFDAITFLPSDATKMYVSTKSNMGNAFSATASLLKVPSCNSCSTCTYSNVNLPDVADFLGGLGTFPVPGNLTATHSPYYQWFFNSTYWSQPNAGYAQCAPSTTSNYVTSLETAVDGSYIANITYTVSFTLTLLPYTEVDVVLKDVNGANIYGTDWGTTTTPTASTDFPTNFNVGPGYIASGGLPLPTAGHYKNNTATTHTYTVTGAICATTHFVDRLEFGVYSLFGYTSSSARIEISNIVVTQPYDDIITSLTANPGSGNNNFYCFTINSASSKTEQVADASGSISVKSLPAIASVNASGSHLCASAVPGSQVLYQCNVFSYALLQKIDFSGSTVTSTLSTTATDPPLHIDERCIAAFNSGGTDSLYMGNDGGISRGAFTTTAWSNINGTGWHSSWGFSIGSSIHNGQVGVAATDNGILNATPNSYGSWYASLGGDGGEAKFGKRYATRNFEYEGNSGSGGFQALTGTMPSTTTSPQALLNPLNTVVNVLPLSKLVTTFNSDYFGTSAADPNNGGGNIYRIDVSTGSGTIASPYSLSPTNLTPGLYYTGSHKHTGIIATAPDMWDPNYIAAIISSNSNSQGAFLYTSNAASVTPTWTYASNYPPDYSPGSTQATNWAAPLSMAVDPRTSGTTKRLWVGCGSYIGATETSRVFSSVDNGGHWSDISYGLPDGPVNVLVYDEQSHYLFAGMDQGVYAFNVDYGANSATNPWVCYSLNLPNSFCTGIDINRCTGKLYASFYGRGAYEADLPPDLNWNGTTTLDGALGNADNFDLDIIPGTVTAPTIWTQDKDETRTIYIGPGKALVLQNCTLSMGRNKNIIVGIGGSLVVQGATITNSCGIMWGTISVLGNPATSQNLTNTSLPISSTSVPYCSSQGFVRLLPYTSGGTTRNPVIENAYLGVAAMGIYYDGTDICDYQAGSEGGLLFADYASFHNCASDVFFEPYPHQVDHSYMSNCHFYGDAPLQNSFFTDYNKIVSGTPVARPYSTETGVYNNNTWGVSFWNDTFETKNNTAISFTPDIDLRGTGYTGYNANASFNGCVFNNMTRGILGTHTWSDNTSVIGNYFTGCWRSVSDEGGNGFICYNNTVTNGPRIVITPPGFTGLTNTMGIIATTTGFHVSQNTVNAGSGSVPDMGIEATGTTGNTLYRNTVNYCTYGMDVDLASLGMPQIKCNILNNTLLSIRLWLSTTLGAVPPNEGSCSNPTGNEFVSTSNQIENNIGMPDNVYTYSNSPYVLYSGDLVNVVPFSCASCTSFASCCPVVPYTTYRIAGGMGAGTTLPSSGVALADLAIVDASISGITESPLQADAVALYTQQFEYISALQMYYDTTLKLDSAAVLLSAHGQYQAAFGYYLRDGNTQKAESMISYVNATDTSLATLMSMALYYASNGISPDSLTSTDSTTLAAKSANRGTPSGEVAYMWYTHAYNLRYFEYFPGGGSYIPAGRLSNNDQQENVPVDQKDKGDVTVYPNPAQDQVTLTDNTGLWGSGSTVTVYDMHGQRMLNVILPADHNSVMVNTQSWASGLYLFTVQMSSGKQYIFKIVVKNE